MGGEIAVMSPAPGCDRGSVFSFSVFVKSREAQRGEPIPLERVESRTTGGPTIAVRERTTLNPALIISVPPALEQECSNWATNGFVGGYGQSHGGEKMNALRVLIIDDDSINVRILVRKFGRAPFDTLEWMIDTASSLPECPEKVITEPSYDILFLDEHFKGDRTTGSAYIKTLRKRGMDAAVFMCSANCTWPDVLRYRRLGAVGVLPKPVPNGETLLTVIYEGFSSHLSGR